MQRNPGLGVYDGGFGGLGVPPPYDGGFGGLGVPSPYDGGFGGCAAVCFYGAGAPDADIFFKYFQFILLLIT
jgi:hypothetical protein